MADEDERELFERAMKDLSKKDMFKGKFGDGDLPDAPPLEDDQPEPVEEELVDRGEVQRVRELATMENVFADVEPLNQSKYRKRVTDTPPMDAPEEPPPPKPTVKPDKKKDPWEHLAERSLDAEVLDLRSTEEHTAFRKLATALHPAEAIRIVYEASERTHIRKSALEAWAIGLGHPFAFSPDASVDQGILIVVRGTTTES